MKKQTKIFLTAMIAAGLAGGAASAAEFPISGSTTVTGDTEYTSTGNNLDGAVTIIGNESRPTVSVADTGHKDAAGTTEHGIIYANGAGKTLNISKLGALNITSDSVTTDPVVGLSVWTGGAIAVSDVDSVNIGTADTPFNTSYAAIQTVGGNVTMTNVGDVNIYATWDGISAQYGAAGKSDSVVIESDGDVTVHAGKGNAVRVMAISGSNAAGTSIHAAGKVTLISDENWAVGSYDHDGVNGQYIGTGTTSIDISGDKGVTIQAPKTNLAVYLLRENNNNSSLNITSANGDVNIIGGNGIQTKLTGGELTGKITGQNVTISSPVSAAIVMQDEVKSDLTLAVNQDGGKITVSTDAAGSNAISVSGDNSSLILGDGTHATDVNINGYVNLVNSQDGLKGGNLTFADKTTTHVDKKYLTNQEKAFITTGNAGSVTMNGNASIMVDGLKTGDTIEKVNLSDNDKVKETLQEHFRTDNLLQQVTFDKETGNMTVGTVDNKEAAALLGGSALTNVALYATGTNNDSITNLITSHTDDTAAIEEALNSAAGLAAMANTAHGTYTMNGIFFDAVSGHLMNRQDQDVWAYGFHSKENVNGLSFGADYDAQYNGIAAGVDFYKKGGTTAGLALIYADSNVSGANGVSSTKNDADYYGVSLYSRFDRGSYALLGDISYMKGDHDITQVNSGETITASPDSDSISVGVKAVKDYAAGENGTLTPYVGLRYLRLSTDDFTASNGLRYEGDDQDLVIVPVGVNYTASISHGKWSVRPYAGIGYVWTAGDRSADQTVMLGGAADSFSYDTADSGSFVARAGVTTDCGDMSYGIGYSWQKGDSVSNNAWTLSASYHF